jgi:hypothetical protein
MTCAISGPDPAPIRVTAVAPQGGSIQAELRLPAPDRVATNNTWRAVLD